MLGAHRRSGRSAAPIETVVPEAGAAGGRRGCPVHPARRTGYRAEQAAGAGGAWLSSGRLPDTSWRVRDAARTRLPRTEAGWRTAGRWRARSGPPGHRARRTRTRRRQPRPVPGPGVRASSRSRLRASWRCLPRRPAPRRSRSWPGRASSRSTSSSRCDSSLSRAGSSAAAVLPGRTGRSAAPGDRPVRSARRRTRCTRSGGASLSRNRSRSSAALQRHTHRRRRS
jgi:hypothetical protein